MQELAFVEFFAGRGEVWKAIRASSINAVKVDITYFTPPDGYDGSNPMDINDVAGFAFHPHFFSCAIESTLIICILLHGIHHTQPIKVHGQAR